MSLRASVINKNTAIFNSYTRKMTMRYLKQASISLLILTALSFSASGNQSAHKAEHKPNLAHEQAKWIKAQNADELKRIAHRATLLQLENL